MTAEDIKKTFDRIDKELVEVDEVLKSSKEFREKVDKLIGNKKEYSKKKQAYNMEYTKNNYKKFSCNLKPDEMEKLNNLLAENNINKSELLRRVISKFELLIKS